MKDATATYVGRARAILAKAEGENRSLTDAEKKEAESYLQRVNEIKASEAWLEGRLQDIPSDLLDRARRRQETEDELVPEIERLRGGQSLGFADAVMNAGFSLKAQPSVNIPAASVFNSTFSAPDTYRVGEAVLAPLGRDRRFLYSNLPIQSVDGQTAVSDFKQTVRTLTGSAIRDIAATTDKASLDVTITHVLEALKQVAVTINDVPNQLLESVGAMRAFLDQEGRFQVEKAIDAHVMAQIVAAAPPFGTSGTGLVARIRNGVATMRATGANPSLVVLNPTDAATLDLEADAGGYIFPVRDSGSSSPLWGLRVIERIGAGTEAPYLIDPQMLGQLYLGSLKFEADPFSGFRKNLTTLRIETNALYHVRQAEGARRINAT